MCHDGIKSCPILSVTNMLRNCVGHNCMWYDRQRDQCVMVLAAKAAYESNRTDKDRNTQ